MTRLLKVMAENELDAIVHKAVEHTPTLISDGTAPPWTDQKGAPHLNTLLDLCPQRSGPRRVYRHGSSCRHYILGKTIFGCRDVEPCLRL